MDVNLTSINEGLTDEDLTGRFTAKLKFQSTTPVSFMCMNVFKKEPKMLFHKLISLMEDKQIKKFNTNPWVSVPIRFSYEPLTEDRKSYIARYKSAYEAAKKDIKNGAGSVSFVLPPHSKVYSYNKKDFSVLGYDSKKIETFEDGTFGIINTGSFESKTVYGKWKALNSPLRFTDEDTEKGLNLTIYGEYLDSPTTPKQSVRFDVHNTRLDHLLRTITPHIIECLIKMNINPNAVRASHNLENDTLRFTLNDDILGVDYQDMAPAFDIWFKFNGAFSTFLNLGLSGDGLIAAPEYKLSWPGIVKKEMNDAQINALSFESDESLSNASARVRRRDLPNNCGVLLRQSSSNIITSGKGYDEFNPGKLLLYKDNTSRVFYVGTITLPENFGTLQIEFVDIRNQEPIIFFWDYKISMFFKKV